VDNLFCKLDLVYLVDLTSLALLDFNDAFTLLLFLHAQHISFELKVSVS